MTTTAEGVETAEDAAILKAEGCDEIQGYFVSRPLSSDQARDFLSNRCAPSTGRHMQTASSRMR